MAAVTAQDERAGSRVGAGLAVGAGRLFVARTVWDLRAVAERAQRGGGDGRQSDRGGAALAVPAGQGGQSCTGRKNVAPWAGARGAAKDTSTSLNMFLTLSGHEPESPHN